MLHQKSPHVLCVTQRLRNSELIDPSFQWHGPKGKIISAYREPHYYYQFTARYHAAPCNSIYNISFEKKLLQILSKLVLDLSCEVSLLKSECHRVKMQRAGLQNELFFTFSDMRLSGKRISWVAQSCPTLCDPMDSSLHQAPPSMGFSRQEYWSGLPFPLYIPSLLCLPSIPLYTDCFESVDCFEESFHAEDKLHLIVVYDPFNVFLESVC
ncbi:hypothetical protein FD754_018539 [Muntiacus muntjak]|uniref:Zona-pellucida-binding protein 1/2 N-terminal domain-containing protein n=1 Tax=Muntiacus muntjak TaxID=9888 RepID=A0A5N3UXP4_MUNMU|nr:hypothetical protein FD754_018539 [Muntiacus muntjak]